MEQIGLRTLFEQLGMGASMSAAAVGSIIARMAQPGSERAARRWLGERSALGELWGWSSPPSGRCGCIAPPMR